MRIAGMSDGSVLHALHLYPSPMGRKAMGIKRVRVSFLEGKTFYGPSGQPYTRWDFPPGAAIVVHTSKAGRVHLKVPVQ
jgi:hypothetical protein